MSRTPAPAGGTPGGAPRVRNSAPLLIIALLAVTIIIVEAATGRAWSILFINPLVNALIVLDILVLGEFGLAILLFTLILRLATLPLTISQFRSMKEMQAIQPLMQEIQKKYKDPKRRQEETMKLYREHHINPLGCAAPLIIQMAFFMALYRALVPTVGGSPESLVTLSQHIYPFSFLQDSIPLKQTFLWLNLGQPDTTFILPLLVGVSTYVQQKVSVTPNASAQMQQQQQMMTFMMPMMMVFISLQLPSGVGVYWVATSLFSLFASWRVYGREFNWRQILSLPAPAPAAAKRPRREIQPQIEASESEEPASTAPARRERSTHGKRRGKRKNRR